MRNIYDSLYLEEILNRIDRLSSHSKRQWGKMDVAQMLAHCSAFQDIVMGQSSPPRSWLGVIIGNIAKPIFFNEKTLPKNMSTIPTILIEDERDFDKEKEELKQKLLKFQADGPGKCTTHPHSFFGKMTAEQWGKGVYKHLDHHLKQFGV